MFKFWFLLLFSLHLVGAFYLQSKRYTYLVYSAVLMSAVLVRPSVVMLLAVAFISAIFTLNERLAPALERLALSEAKIFFVRQLFMLLSIAMAAWALRYEQGARPWPQYLTNDLLGVAAMLLFAGRPSNDIIRCVLNAFERSEGRILPSESLLHGGKTIGILERVLAGLMLYAGQWTALGLIFTGKGIIRWKNISKDNTEYFLIGTLLSLLCIVGSYLIIF